MSPPADRAPRLLDPQETDRLGEDELKADPATASIPIVAFTALAMKSDEERVRRAGFDGYLTKPLDREALERVVAAFLSRPRA